MDHALFVESAPSAHPRVNVVKVAHPGFLTNHSLLGVGGCDASCQALSSSHVRD